MPAQSGALRGAPDLLLVFGCAAFVVGVVAVGHGVFPGEERAERISGLALAPTAAESPSRGRLGDRSVWECGRPDVDPCARSSPADDSRRPAYAQTRRRRDDSADRLTSLEFIVQREYLLHSAAVVHRRGLGRPQPAPPVGAAEMAVLALSSGAP